MRWRFLERGNANDTIEEPSPADLWPLASEALHRTGLFTKGHGRNTRIAPEGDPGYPTLFGGQ